MTTLVSSKNMIYEEQARFVVWNLSYLFGALLERGNEDIKLDAVCMHFISRGMLSFMKNIDRWLARKGKKDVYVSHAEAPEVISRDADSYPEASNGECSLDFVQVEQKAN